MRRCAVLAILTYRKYVPVAVLRAPSLTPARYAYPQNPPGANLAGFLLPICRVHDLAMPAI